MLAIASDHGGYELKTHVSKFLIRKGIRIKDFGTYSTDSVDYPDYSLAVAENILSGECSKGILICGTGIGISIAANKVPGIRAALCNDCFSARMSREHNNANVLVLGGRVIGLSLALDIVDTWQQTEFSGGRHQARLEKILQIENKYSKNLTSLMNKAKLRQETI